MDKTSEGEPIVKTTYYDLGESNDVENEPLQYVKEIEIHDGYIIQHWNSGTVEVGVFKEFMDYPYMSVFAAQDDIINIICSVY